MSHFPTGFTPVYVGQVANNLTGEHTAIMIKPLLHQEDENEECTWLKAFFSDFRRRLVNLLGFEFRAFSARKYGLESWSSDVFLRYLAARNFTLSGTDLLRDMTYSCCEELGTFKPSFYHQH